MSGALISPNGDGIVDSVKVSLAATGATSWAFGVAPINGSRVGPPILIRFGAGGTARLTWTGRTSAGTIAPDGTYQLQLLVADAAGNRASRILDRSPRSDRARDLRHGARDLLAER